MAVGARRSDILSLVVGEGARLAAGGFCAGILGTLGLTRFMKSILFGVTPTDPATLAGVVLLMAFVVLIACVLPAPPCHSSRSAGALRDE
jgi:putative ABC transport system permease protein